MRKLLLLSALAVAACSDGPTGPTGPVTRITLDACGDLGAVFGADWIAIRNEGTGWEQITPSITGLSFDATDRFSLAIAASFFGTTFTQVLNVTVDEIQDEGSSSLCDLFGNRVIRGAVAGVTGEQHVDIFGAGAFDFASASDLQYELTDLPDQGTIDVVALRYPTAFTQPPDRVIVRRGLIPNNNGLPISTMDFAAEGVALQSNTVTVTNGGTGPISVESAVTTGNGTYVPLGTLGSIGTSAFNYVSLPASLRFSTDLHELALYAGGATTDRSLIRYYSTPADLTVAMGPDVSVPTVTTVATAPYQRVRAVLPSQSEYGLAAMADFSQQVGESSFKVVSVTTTRGYAGGTTPSSWELEIPDFSGSGYQAAWGLSSGAYEWSVTAVSGDPVFGDVPAAGVTFQFASRYSSIIGASVARGYAAAARKSTIPRPLAHSRSVRGQAGAERQAR